MQPTPVSVSAVHPTGFTIALQVDLQDLDTTLADLLARGYRPTSSGSADRYMRTPSGEPLCPRHQVVMRLREKQGDSWWSHQVIDPRTGEELYCRGYPDRKHSPGWEIAAPA